MLKFRFVEKLNLKMICIIATGIYIQNARAITVAQSKWASETSLSYSNSLYDHQDGTASKSWDIETELSYKILKNWTVVSSLSASKDVVDESNIKSNGISDLSLVLAQKQQSLFSGVLGGFSFVTVLPTSEYSNKVQNLKGKVGAGYSFGIDPDNLITGLSINFKLSAIRNFHRYETDTAGNILNQWRAKEDASVSYSYNKWSFSAGINHFHDWSYTGEVSQFFKHTESVSYEVNKKWDVSFGHVNAGSWLQDNGKDLNLKTVDENESILFFATAVRF